MRSRSLLVWAILAGPVVAGLLRLPGGAWSALLGYHAGCWVLAGRSGTGFGRRPRAAALAGVACGTTLAVLVGFAALRGFRPALFGPVGAWQHWGVRPPADLAILAYYALVNPWIEERFWRGALLGEELLRRHGVGRMRALAVVAFVPHHLAVLVPSFGAPLAMALAGSILLAGWLWTELRLRSGHLWWGVASHLGADLGLCLVYALWLRP